MFNRFIAYVKENKFKAIASVWLLLLSAAIYGFLGAPVPLFYQQTSGQIGVMSVPLWSAPNYYTLQGESGAVLNMKSGSDFEVKAGATEVHAAPALHTGVESFTNTVNFTGEVTATVIHVTGVLGNVTPVPTTQIYGAVISPTEVIISNTPVVPFATPQTLFIGAAATNQYWQCGTTIVTGTASITPIAGATVVRSPLVSLDAINGDAENVSGIYANGLITFTASHVLLGTPVANATPVNVQWCYIYNK